MAIFVRLIYTVLVKYVLVSLSLFQVEFFFFRGAVWQMLDFLLIILVNSFLTDVPAVFCRQMISPVWSSVSVLSCFEN